VHATGLGLPGITTEKKKGSKKERKACLINIGGIA
jgi:hypothetical protein